ncbi:DUF3291 domain-containing protein [Pontivivens ytuae]|uniref:DUF3291 domain-containing protein n=1 Tax=Pontivivens ytuae TaxID=2789856 RepID=A0A7S9LUG1_9RHOB|nr:DUF3291 domain-containing protein [Pontivivens ytuae]QPH55339.1 DUF3291 domain-containing protein [Pontivivens ytuae]
MACVALYTFGIFVRPADAPANDGFREMNDPIFEIVDRAPGLIARSGYADEPEGPASWGPEVYPRWYVERGDGWSPATLSLWESMEAAFAFSYSGMHAEALKRGAEWFRPPEWPPYALWWHEGDERPTWADGVARHAHLDAHGATAQAFTFKEAFDTAGAPMRLARDWRRHREGAA